MGFRRQNFMRRIRRRSIRADFISIQPDTIFEQDFPRTSNRGIRNRGRRACARYPRAQSGHRHHLSLKLAQYFVADDPPKPLVSRMAQQYLATDGDIRAALKQMFSSAEFWDGRTYGAKFKTPYEYVVSCVRASGAPVRNYRPLFGTMQILGMPIYGCQTPNGYANTQDAWLNPDAMMTRLSFATALGCGKSAARESAVRGGGPPNPQSFRAKAPGASISSSTAIRRDQR